MNLDRSRLQNILGIIGTAVGNKVLDVADYVHFSVDREARRLLISCTNFNAFLTMEYGDLTLTTLDDVSDVFLVEFKKLNSIIKASTTDGVEIVCDDNSVTVTTNGRYKLPKHNEPEAFPHTDYEYTEMARWPVPLLKSAWDKTVVAVSDDVTKVAYQGVNYDGNFAATDNRRLAVYRGAADYDGPSMLLPPVFGDVIKHCKNEVSVGPNTNGNMLVIRCAEVGLLACVRLLDADFNDYQRILGMREDGLKLTVSRDEFIKACQRLSVFTDALYKVVRLSVVYDPEDGLQLCMSIHKDGEGAEALDISYDGDEEFEPGPVAQYSYHLDNVEDGAKVIGTGPAVDMEFGGNGFLWIDSEQSTYLLTPMQD